MNDYTTQQHTAIAHLREWKVGALFMEPGTGKTRVAMTLVNSSDCSDVFWVGPLRTLDNAKTEAAKWGGFTMTAHYYGVESLSGSDRIYMQLVNEVEQSREPFVVIDESLKIKNATAKRTKRMLEVGKRARWKLVLNGTPVSRNLLDMWPQMEFLSPRILSMSLAEFKNTFCRTTTITKKIGSYKFQREYITGMENVDYLHSLIRHYVYECDLQLMISQRWHTMHYYISDGNRENYEWVKEQYLSDEMLEWRNNNIFFAMTTEMQMTYTTDPDKLRVVHSIFDDYGVSETETIIFCRYIKSQQLCQAEFPDAQVLTIQKGGIGLNLQQYRHTIYFDKVWDYALYQQSTRRTFRTGQEHDCHYWELTGDVGLERMIDRNIEKKISMSEYLKRVSLEELKKEL